MGNIMNKTRRFKNWLDELRYRVNMDGELDEKYQNGVYDMAIDIVVAIEARTGQRFRDKDVDDVVEIIYQAVKYGDNIN